MQRQLCPLTVISDVLECFHPLCSWQQCGQFVTKLLTGISRCKIIQYL
jgi:hypothetical protein